MLKKLTPEQEARFPEFVEFGKRIGLSTERSNRPAAEKALRDHYRACGLDEPKQILWFDSPWASVSVWDSVRDSVRGSVRDSVWFSVWASVGYSVSTSVWASVGYSVSTSVRDSVWASVGNSVRDSVGDSVGGSAWSCVGAHYDADDAAYIMAWDQYGISLPKSALTMMHVSEHIWWYYPDPEIVYVSDRPTSIRQDDQGRLHCETGKAIEFADGNGLSAWHGQTIPDEWVTGALPTPKEALHWPIMDQRTVACELVGWHTLREFCKAKTIDKSDDPMWGELVQMDLPDSPKERFLFAICGTGRQFALPVPPETKTVDEAQSILHGGLPVELLKHSVRRT